MSCEKDLGGFNFDGKCCGDLGLLYVPEAKNTYVWNEAAYKLSEEMFDGHDGGYFYGTTLQPKPFSLRCVFINEEINDGIMTRIYSHFKRGKTGKLFFEKRPWLHYDATVTSVDTTGILNNKNGFVTINMKAYYPFSIYDHIHLPKVTDPEYVYTENIKNNSNLLYQIVTPTTEYTNLEDQTTIILYNGGTENAKTLIEIQGDTGAAGIRIFNKTTGVDMKIVGMTDEDGKQSATSGSKYYEINSKNGMCKLVDTLNNTSELKFLWHQYGFIDLAPNVIVKENVFCDPVENESKLRSMQIDTNDIGKYIYQTKYVDGEIVTKYYKITAIDTVDPTLVTVMTKDGAPVSFITEDVFATQVVTMNEIIITPEASMDINYIKFKYNPTFN